MERDPWDLPGMRRNPWRLKTTDGKTDFAAFRDTTLSPPALVIRAGERELRYHLRCLDDLYEMLKERGGWVPLGSAEEHEAVTPGSVEEWACSVQNPLGGWYGLKKGSRGGFATFVPPVMETLKLAEVEGNPRDGRMRAV